MSESFSCGCVGPQNGEPFCPCMMRGMVQRNGRWIRPEQDCGPIRQIPPFNWQDLMQGLSNSSLFTPKGKDTKL